MAERGKDRYLFISDLQIPFHNSSALEFCKFLQREYSIPKENILCSGDELDNYYGSVFRKDANAGHTAIQEIDGAKEETKRWVSEFPLMRLCESNHGMRWKKKAFEAEIPEILLRQYQEVMEFPRGWKWAGHWDINTKKPFMVCHGDDYGGGRPHIEAAMHNGKSCAIGHHHNLFSVDFIKTKSLDIWGAVAGCLINPDSYAFNYTKGHKRKPKLGCLVILDDGFRPVLHPLPIK